MYKVIAKYPTGASVLVGTGRTMLDVEDLLADVYAANGGKAEISNRGIELEVQEMN